MPMWCLAKYMSHSQWKQNICLIPNENILNKNILSDLGTHGLWGVYVCMYMRRVRTYVYCCCVLCPPQLLTFFLSERIFFWKSPVHTILTFSKIPCRPLIEPNVVSVYPIKSKLTIIRVCEVQRGQFGWCDIIDWPMSTFNTQWKESWINFQNGVESFFTWPFE